MAKCFVSFSVVLLIVFANSSLALRCYRCQYTDSDDADEREGEPTCKSGSMSSSLSGDCASKTYVQVAENTFVPQESFLGRNVKNVTILTPEQRQLVSYSCIKLTLDGTRIQVPPVKADITARDCVVFLGTAQEKCYANKNSEILNDIDDVQVAAYVTVFGLLFTGDTDVGFCTCNGENCNGAMNSVTASMSLLLMTTFIGFFYKFI